MSVEFSMLRKDNKTVFELGKSLNHEILDVVFSQEELLQYLIIWQIQLWADSSVPVSALTEATFLSASVFLVSKFPPASAFTNTTIESKIT